MVIHIKQSKSQIGENMLTGLIFGIVVAIVLWLMNQSRKKAQIASFDRWKEQHLNATKEEVEFETKCREIIANGNLSDRQLRVIEMWHNENPNASHGELASKVIEIKYRQGNR